MCPHSLPLVQKDYITPKYGQMNKGWTNRYKPIGSASVGLAL